MSFSYDQLKHTKISDLRQIAADLDHEAVQGYTQLRKDQLVKALCTALGIEAHEHHEVKGLDKSAIKKQIRELKVQRDAALVKHDHMELKVIRRKIHRLKRSLHRATV